MKENKPKMSFTQFLKSFFLKSTDQPVSESEKKWYMVSFFATFCLMFLMGVPLLLLAGELRNAVKLSFYWFAIFGGLIGWPVSWLFTLGFWMRVSHNFGLFMYKSHLRDEEKKKRKASIHAQGNLEEKNK